jgi:protein ImuB
MYACIHVPGLERDEESLAARLIECAYTFSPRVEATSSDTVVLDAHGSEALFGAGWDLAQRIAGHAAQTCPGRPVNVAVAANPDAAIHAARGLCGTCFIPAGRELEFLGGLGLARLVPALAGVGDERALELVETLRLWGIRSFRDFAALPENGVAERLGAEGVRLQQLARGTSRRSLVPVPATPVYFHSVELEHPLDLREPLQFFLARLVHQLCATLAGRARAASELRLRLRLERGGVEERSIRLAFPMREPRLFLKLLELELDERPVASAVVALALSAEPAPPRVTQKGLFLPLAPEPEKLELVLARIAKLVGWESVGSPEPLDTHRPDAFRMNRFGARAGAGRYRAPELTPALRRFRPPLPASVRTDAGGPVRVRVNVRSFGLTGAVDVVARAGPWRSSGDWWAPRAWRREEWDVELADGILYRVYRDPAAGAWFVEGMYD